MPIHVNVVNISGRIADMSGDSYHHGALHEALLAAAVEEARSSGPQAISVRALAKAVGVSPSAVYRHVPSIDALTAEVAQIAREELARRLVRQRDRAPQHRTRKARARERFRAVGRGYIEFALAHPHLFDTAFAPTTCTTDRPDDPSAWQVLADGVQELVDAGALPGGAADAAALIAWSGVHGIASILVRGALLEECADEAAVDVVLDGVMRAIETL